MHLLVHYHRVDADYGAFHLLVHPSSSPSAAVALRQPRAYARTSFGAVFRLDLSLLRLSRSPSSAGVQLTLLPFRASLKRPDLPARSVFVSSTAVQHVFIAQHDAIARSSPFQFPPQRFLFFALDQTRAPAPVLHVHAQHAGSVFHHLAIFPATHMCAPPDAPPVYILDTLKLDRLLATAQVNVYFTAVLNTALFHPPPITPPGDQPLLVPTEHRVFKLSLQLPDVTHVSSAPAAASPAPESMLAQIVQQQSLTNPALSKHYPLHHATAQIQSLSSLPTPPTKLHGTSKNRLVLYYHHDHLEAPPSPAVPEGAAAPENNHTASTSKQPKLFIQSSNPSSKLTIQILENIKPRPNTTIYQISSSSPLQSEELNIMTESNQKFQWVYRNGCSVILSPSYPTLIPPPQAFIRLYYHRFDNFADWYRWRLQLTCKATGRCKILKAFKVNYEGTIFFNLDKTYFSYDNLKTVQLKTFRIASKSPFTSLNLNEMEENVPDADNISISADIDKVDVPRDFGELEQNFNEYHIIQSDTSLHKWKPSRTSIVSKKKVVLRYRRILTNDYEDWDLWTWEENSEVNNNNNTNHLPIQGTINEENKNYIDFVIDRSNYGASKYISILPRKGGDKWVEKDSPVRIISMNDIFEMKSTDTNKDSLPVITIVQGEPTIFTNLIDQVKSMVNAYVDSNHSIIIKTPVPIDWISSSTNSIASTTIKLNTPGGKNRVLEYNRSKELTPSEIQLTFESEDFNEDFPVEHVSIEIPGFHLTKLKWEIKQNLDEYYYDGELGCMYERTKCIFRVFAPTCDELFLVLYSKYEGDEGRQMIPMRKIPQGCWKVIIQKDLKGMYYKLLAKGSDKKQFPGVEVIDPYSKCNTAHNGRGFIFGKDETFIEKRPDINPIEAIIYELHIRDITIDENSGIKKRGKFIGLTEHGTRMKNHKPKQSMDDKSSRSQQPQRQQQPESSEDVNESSDKLGKYSTGLDHIIQMGVNTVQLLPIQDFDNDELDDTAYRWGYMPVHFNSPDGWYASKTFDQSRITEFKQLVNTFHKAGIKVIMDVVYNHTAEDSNEYNVEARFSFNGLAPRYYYRNCGNTPVAHTGDKTCALRKPSEDNCGECFSNGSGCGNEFRSESPMGRKFIVDSLVYWVKEYKVDGFRFDLMGLIDVGTMEHVTNKLKAIDENIMVYGEPWCGGLSPIRITEKGMQRSKRFGVFNNTFRDAIRGSPFESEETFVMDGGKLAEIKGGIIASVDVFTDSPEESLNYVECHDNYTLWDHFRFYIRERTDDIHYSQDDLRRMHRLAAVVVFTSQGVAFLQAGQEMCRTKYDVENSYESPDSINMIKWDNKVREWDTVRYYHGLIKLRSQHPEIFCKPSKADIHKAVIFYEDLGLPVPPRCIAYRVNGDATRLLKRLRRTNAVDAANDVRQVALEWTQVVVLLNPTPSQVLFQLPGAVDDTMWMQVVDARRAGVNVIRGPAIGFIHVEGRSAAVLRKASKQDAADAQLNLRLDAVSDSYCSFHGDDALSRYAVGLHKQPTEEEAVEQKRLKDLRTEFEKYQASVKLSEETSTKPAPPSR